MRGRLIQRFLAEMHRLDVAATRAVDPDGAGPLTSGFDDDFREPVNFIPAVGAPQQLGETTRQEKGAILVPCQLRSRTFDQIQQLFSGNAPDTLIDVAFHFRDLEKMGLVDGGGKAMIRVGDRLGAILDTDGALVQTIPNPPGLYVTHARSAGFGVNMATPSRNLLVCTLEDRERGVRA